MLTCIIISHIITFTPSSLINANSCGMCLRPWSIMINTFNTINHLGIVIIQFKLWNNKSSKQFQFFNCWSLYNPVSRVFVTLAHSDLLFRMISFCQKFWLFSNNLQSCCEWNVTIILPGKNICKSAKHVSNQIIAPSLPLKKIMQNSKLKINEEERLEQSDHIS